MYHVPRNLSEYYWLLAGVYLVSTVLMVTLVPHLRSTWLRSFTKRTRPSLFLRWHPLCPGCVATYGYTLMRPDNEDKRDLWLFSVFPVLNTVMVLFYTLVIPCVMVRSLYVALRFGSEDNYRRWLRSY